MRGGSLPHARGHDPRGKRLGRRVDQNSRSPDRAASPSGTSRYPTRTEFGRHLVQSRQATHTRQTCLKRKAPVLARTVGKNQAKRTGKTPIKEQPNAYGISLVCEKNMVRIGGFLKTQNRIRRHRARGWFISPYQMGGTIFGKSTMARYPLMYTSSRLTDPSPWRR